MTSEEQAVLDRLPQDLRKQVEAALAQPQASAQATDSTHICMLLDRTGSMSSIAKDTIGGVNTFLAEQRKAPGACTFTLVQFDTQDPHEIVQDFVNIADAKDLTEATYQPRGGTPLYDAICKTIADCEAKVAAAKDKPSKVVFVIVTDGEENSSNECGKTDAVAAIKRCEDKGWQVVYLGVGINAMADATAIGIKAATTMNVGKSTLGVTCCFAATSANLLSYRGCPGPNGAAGPAGDAGSLAYTSAHRQEQDSAGAVKA